MYHTVEFVGDLVLDLEVNSRQPLERLQIYKGTQVTVQLKPYVVESEYGPVEVADLYFEDGTVTRTVPFGCFSFVEKT